MDSTEERTIDLAQRAIQPRRDVTSAPTRRGTQLALERRLESFAQLGCRFARERYRRDLRHFRAAAPHQRNHAPHHLGGLAGARTCFNQQVGIEIGADALARRGIRQRRGDCGRRRFREQVELRGRTHRRNRRKVSSTSESMSRDHCASGELCLPYAVGRTRHTAAKSQ